MRETIRSRFRSGAGFDKDHICGDCRFSMIVYAGSRKVWKCRKMGLSSSSATDIRKKDIACTLFEQDGE